MKLYNLGGGHYINLDAIAEIMDNSLRMVYNDEWYVLDDEQLEDILERAGI